MKNKIKLNIGGDNYEFDPVACIVEYTGLGDLVHFSDGDYIQQLLFTV